MEAGTNDNFRRLDLHFGTWSLLPDGTVLYVGVGSNFHFLLHDCLLIQALYRLVFSPPYDFQSCFVHVGKTRHLVIFFIKAF